MAFRAVLALFVVVLLSIQPASADLWYEAYEKAKQALAAEDWGEAIRQIELALEKKGESNARARTYGMNFIQYFPYYQLGVAYYNLGQYREAAQAFETEERLGEILQSDPQLAELRRLRASAQEQTEAREQTKIQEVIAQSLARAETLKNEGRFDEALGALEQAIALEPAHSRANALREEIRVEVTRRQEEQAVRAQVDQLIAEGRSQLAAGRFQDAASSFSRAADLEDSPQTRALRDEAQNRLRAEIESREIESRRRVFIESGLSAAGRLKDTGDYQEALSELQAILALDPRNDRALGLQSELFELQNEAERTAARKRQIADLLERGEAALEHGDYGDLVVAANQLLALDPENAEARAYRFRGYSELNRRGLGKNTKPYLMISGPNPGSLDDGVDGEVIRSPVILLIGSVSDETTVSVHVSIGDEPLKVNRYPRPGIPRERIDLDFRVSHRIAPPISFAREQLVRLRAVAKDAEGESRGKQYTFLYIAPLYRWFWTYAVLAVACAALAAIVGTRRVRRRNELVKRRFNPYIAGAPILEAELFFGREKLMTRVLQTMHNNSILLYGERRIGKTSFQHRLMQRLQELQDPNYDFYPVFIDLQGAPQERFFATLAEEVFEELGPILGSCQPDPSLHSGTDYQYREFVRDLRAVIKVLKGKTPKRVKLTLLIDEVDELNNYDPRINQRLRSLFMRNFSENLVAVVSGVAIKKKWESEGSPWYNFFEEIQVKPFRREDALKLIEDPIKGIFKLEAGVVDSIIEKTGSRPFLIQKYCVALVNRLHEEKRRCITLHDVEAVGRVKEA